MSTNACSEECKNCISIFEEEMRPRTKKAFGMRGIKIVNFFLTLGKNGFTATMKMEHANPDVPNELQFSNQDPGQLIENIEAYARSYTP